MEETKMNLKKIKIKNTNEDSKIFPEDESKTISKTHWNGIHEPIFHQIKDHSTYTVIIFHDLKWSHVCSTDFFHKENVKFMRWENNKNKTKVEISWPDEAKLEHSPGISTSPIDKIFSHLNK